MTKFALKHNFEFCPNTIYAAVEGMCDYAPATIGFMYKAFFSFYENETGMAWYYRDDLLKVGKQVGEKLCAMPQWAKTLRIMMNERLNEVESLLQKFEKEDISKVNEADLLELYLKAIEAYKKLFGFAPACEATGLYMQELVSEKLPSQGFSRNTINILLSPSCMNYVIEEELDLVRIALEKKNIEDSLAAHAKKYFWIENDYRFSKRLDVKYFRERLNMLLELQKDELEAKLAKHNAVMEKKQQLLAGIKDKEILALLEIIDDLIHIHDSRKKGSVIGVHCIFEVLKELAKRKGIAFETLKYATPIEIKGMLSGKPLKETELSSRLKLYAVVIEDGEVKLLTGKPALDLKEELEKDEVQNIIAAKEARELKGTPASLGVAKGKVKVLLSAKEIAKLKQGEILVASSTTPDFVLAIRRAAAIVTEKGGITSHAAIVSRELGVPCIVGIENITQVLKDGDIVEVDADEGIVRIIERKR